MCVRAYISPALCGSVGARSIAPHGHVVAGGWGAADMTAQFKEMEQGDAGWERTERPLYVPRLSLGKVCSPPRGYRQGGKWTYRCCIVLLRLQSLNNMPCISMRAEC